MGFNSAWLSKAPPGDGILSQQKRQEGRGGEVDRQVGVRGAVPIRIGQRHGVVEIHRWRGCGGGHVAQTADVKGFTHDVDTIHQCICSGVLYFNAIVIVNAKYYNSVIEVETGDEPGTDITILSSFQRLEAGAKLVDQRCRQGAWRSRAIQLIDPYLLNRIFPATTLPPEMVSSIVAPTSVTTIPGPASLKLVVAVALRAFTSYAVRFTVAPKELGVPGPFGTRQVVVTAPLRRP